MCQNLPDIELATIEMHRRNQPILVSADIEYDMPAHQVCCGKGLFEVDKRCEVSLADDPIPSKQRLLGRWIHLPEISQGSLRNHMHEKKVSHYEISVKSGTDSPAGTCCLYRPSAPKSKSESLGAGHTPLRWPLPRHIPATPTPLMVSQKVRTTIRGPIPMHIGYRKLFRFTKEALGQGHGGKGVEA